jgi:hypothetical protein
MVWIQRIKTVRRDCGTLDTIKRAATASGIVRQNAVSTEIVMEYIYARGRRDLKQGSHAMQIDPY